jgi:hypothetical protein
MTTAPTRIRLSRPADVLGMVPFLLGFYPKESVVALLLKSVTVVLTIRVNMPPPEEAGDVAANIASLSDQHGAEQLVIIGYSVKPEAREVLASVATKLDSYALKDVLFVDGQRWWSLMCSGNCCPAEGQPYDPSSSPSAAEAVYAGLGVLADRTALQAEVSGPPSEDRKDLRQLARQQSAKINRLNLEARCELLRTLVESAVAQAEPVDDVTCVQLAVLVAEVTVRDVAWGLITRDQADGHLQLWARVVSRTTAPLEAAPVCLLGFCAWVCGHGAMMNCCIERVMTIDPDYSMGHLLNKISLLALPPTLWDELGGHVCSLAQSRS